MSIAGVTQELLVRYLDAWTPGVLHAGKRATFAYATGNGDPAAAEAALRVFAEFGDMLRGRKLTYVAVAPQPDLGRRLDALQAELRTPAGLAVHTVAGHPDDLLAPALSAAGSAGAPLLVFAETEEPAVRVAAAGRPAELLSLLPPGHWTRQRDALVAAGFDLVCGVELTNAGDADRLLAFATGRAKNLEAFKNELWSVDEYAGVRYRDPADPDRHPLDISLDPHPGPLRRALLARLADAGPQTVTELRHHTMTATVYRAGDATRVLTGLLHAGTVTSDAPTARLSGDTVITLLT